MTVEPKRPLKVFLCHAHADRDPVRALYTRLTQDGVDAWLDKEKLLPGQDWELEIRKAVREADVVVVCLSKQFNQAGFRQKEVHLALDTAMEKPEGEIFIIPARLDECDTLESLRKWHWVDLFEDGGYEILLRAFGIQKSEIKNGVENQTQFAIQNDQMVEEIAEKKRIADGAQVIREIEQTLIPSKMPVSDLWQIAVRQRLEEQFGGGDFYDVIELTDEKLGFLIADIPGFGLPVTLFKAITRSFIRALVIDLESPAEVLRRVSNLWLSDTNQIMFVTAVYGVLDTKQNTFTYVNAGHNPPFWNKSNGKVEKLVRTAVALGVMEQPIINERVIPLDVGDILLFYTDGLTEAYSPREEFFGEDRLKNALSSSISSSAEDVLSNIESQLDDFLSSTRLVDDLTMLVLKRIK